MKQVFRNRKGNIVLEEVPVPVVTKGKVLVKVLYSLISSGTEAWALQSTHKDFSRKLLHPTTIMRAVQKASADGMTSLYRNLKSKLATLTPLGYSVAGRVVEKAEDIDDVNVGDYVACMGAEYAHHAEFVAVPRNMVVPFPSSVNAREASFVTLGAIALHAVRNANVQLGDTVGVAGLGLIGQLVVQFLKLSGARVIGFDRLKSRIDLAKQHGLDVGVSVSEKSSFSEVMNFTNNVGLDAALICTTTNDHNILGGIASVCRDRGRFIVVGNFDLHLPHATLYRKELTVLVSRSAGPGRYDEAFESHNVDYPIGYVRWTERRNAEEFLRLLALQRISVKELMSKVFDFRRAKDAYHSLLEGSHLGIILRYGNAV